MHGFPTEIGWPCETDMRPSLIAFLFIAFSTVCASPVPINKVTPFAYEMLRQGNLRKEVQDKRMNLKNTDEHAVLLGYMTIFNVGLAGGKAQPTNQGSKVAVPTSKLKDGKALDVERIPDEKMLEYDFDMWLNAIDKEEKLKHWWLGLNNRWVLSYHDKAGSASEPLDHF